MQNKLVLAVFNITFIMKGPLKHCYTTLGFPFSKMRPHTFTPPKLLLPGGVPVRYGMEGVGRRQGGGGWQVSVFCLYILKKHYFAWESFHLPESSYNYVPESTYLFIQQIYTEYTLFIEYSARH